MRREFPRGFSASDQPATANMSNASKEILLDASSLAWRLNVAGRCPQNPAEYRFHQALVLLGHRLINLSTLMDSRLTSGLERNLHLGLSAFVATFFVGPTHKISDFRLLAGLIRAAAEDSLVESRDNMEVMMWTLSMAKTDMFDGAGGKWLIQTVARLVSGLEIQSREEFERTLRKYPWVELLHDESAQDIWHELVKHNSEN